MKSAVAFAVLAAVVSAVPLVEKREGGEVYTFPAGRCFLLLRQHRVDSLLPDLKKRTGGEVYTFPAGTFISRLKGIRSLDIPCIRP